jgi:predicted MFS family arabinose efflux permease
MNPATNYLIIGEERGRGVLMGIKQSGSAAGPFISGGLLLGLASAHGWRAPMAVMAAVSLAAVTLALLPRRPVRSPGHREPRGDRPASRVPSLRHAVAVTFLMAFVQSAVSAFGGLYLVDHVGTPLGQAGAWLAVGGIIGITARILWAAWYGRLILPATVMGVVTMGAVLGQVLLLATTSGLRWLALVALVLNGVGTVAWMSVINIALVESRPADIGRTTGTVYSFFYLGSLAAPLAMGAIADLTGSLRAGWVLTLAASIAGFALVTSRAFWKTPARAPAGSALEWT